MTTATQLPLPRLTTVEYFARKTCYTLALETLGDLQRLVDRLPEDPDVLSVPGQTLEQCARGVMQLDAREVRLAGMLYAAAAAVGELLYHQRRRAYTDVYPVMKRTGTLRLETRGALDQARSELYRWKTRFSHGEAVAVEESEATE